MTEYLPIENYGVIGDLRTIALVGMNGSIDFMCFPDFDSPSIFARLLDFEKGGCFRISPLNTNSVQRQLYIPDTNILLTRFLMNEGVCEVSDFMPVASPGRNPMVVRRVKAVRGDIHIRMNCKPAFNYGRSAPQIEIDNHIARFTNDDLHLQLFSEIALNESNGAVSAEFLIKQGNTKYFVLEQYTESTDPQTHDQQSLSNLFRETLNYWQTWIAKSTYRGRWREMVHRSALALKLMTSKKYGSIVAAPTFGLPEEIGGSRNWDYRYSWIRDSAFTIYAFIRLGFTEEAVAYTNWLSGRCQDIINDSDRLQIMYHLDGSRVTHEEELPHLEGYRGSSPVRIGNGAADQLQLDIFGELMDSIYLTNKYGDQISSQLWVELRQIVNWVCENWEQPDEGIWEVRGGKQHFLYSRLMCWVAIDRGLRLAERRSFPAPIDHWRSERDKIYEDIHTNFWNQEKSAFVQVKNGTALDASSLLMPLVRFISPVDPKYLRHLKAIESELVLDSLVKRYIVQDSAHDGLTGDEGTFSICTFWYLESLSRAGETTKARFYFEKMLGYANHLGLFSEELGEKGEHLGNFPQAFTHLALISTAYDINRRISNNENSS